MTLTTNSSGTEARVDARLLLEDGQVYQGQSFGYEGAVGGEVVFNTGMVGYPETLTDPSYRGQILAMTYPLVGNYGIPAGGVDQYGLPLGFESGDIHVSGLIVAEYSSSYSHHHAVESLGEWMKRNGIPGITGVDTRALTRHLRSRGTMLGKIETPTAETEFVDPNSTDLVSQVTGDGTRALGDIPGAPRVVLVDCGCKSSIARALASRGLNVVMVPYDDYFLEQDYDGLLLSNGPGDPRNCPVTIQHAQHALAVGKPILGICLGHQVLSLAAGAETYKLKFGHRGQNQPCIDTTGDGKKCVITSQNHGYAVREETLPDDWNTWFKNANDGTVEGIRHRSKPFWGVQFHPEATPGPTDTAYIFDQFADAVKGVAR